MKTNVKRREGVVISNKMEKTVVVNVDNLIKDRLTGKIVRKRKKFYAHDESQQCDVGDYVLIEETRPLSRLKRWRVVEILRKKA
ncbi:MAG TPA: 30S ribosomal protein S17 [Candidatus Mcinerneyibacteriales bacterium]|nr:30S ribosomal protein S17 [Candidatus Mcinerneyibacteriales bacterium]HPE21114.1 30S ribosomal protein S17 [Candidatus Mcinerneyibacteriales bacterium]HPJ70440.1 30S ribosomal protein S17 [Candidatus Mcinerneyibacteriales bacterium]HPQ89130.1 30S ribosomal protein S17 [Candidatus Mcinerneyibacteriales bacterium]